jgi:predicted house-cleaning noncanonical NTP pyrophosphatase (MazG superfamily)
MQKEYNKAIRDRIPEIIEKSGKKCSIKKLSDKEFLPYIEQKIIEESDEYFSSRSVEELADLLEVIFRVAELKGTSFNELEKIRIKKQGERGNFSKNFVLVSTDV